MTKRSPEKRRGAAAPRPPKARTPGYDELLAIARLVESGSRFTALLSHAGLVNLETLWGS